MPGTGNLRQNFFINNSKLQNIDFKLKYTIITIMLEDLRKNMAKLEECLATNDHVPSDVQEHIESASNQVRIAAVKLSDEPHVVKMRNLFGKLSEIWGVDVGNDILPHLYATESKVEQVTLIHSLEMTLMQACWALEGFMKKTHKEYRGLNSSDKSFEVEKYRAALKEVVEYVNQQYGEENFCRLNDIVKRIMPRVQDC